ncbi:MAG: DUF4864 domain-containing protein [Actinobacteria bacterium]|nr:MAG: DUF4864 domain-containing protein [Actinomycetota bacterium]
MEGENKMEETPKSPDSDEGKEPEPEPPHPDDLVPPPPPPPPPPPEQPEQPEQPERETPPSQPAAPATMAPPPELPQKSNKKWWFIGCGCLLLLCIAVAVVGAFLGYGIFRAVASPVEPIKGQLEALNEGDVQKAYYQYTSRGFQQETSLEQFQRIVEENPDIFKSRSSSFRSVSIENDTATVRGTITGRDGTVSEMEYGLVKENGEWKIQRFQEQ